MENFMVFLVFILAGLQCAFSIDCYVCTSIGGENKPCEDYFNRDHTTAMFITRKCFFGYFEGTHCIKLKGKKEDGTDILVRQCGNYDWGSHCGEIKYQTGDNEDETEKVYGCLQSCDFDGCNSGRHVCATRGLLFICLSVIALLFLRHR